MITLNSNFGYSRNSTNSIGSFAQIISFVAFLNVLDDQTALNYSHVPVTLAEILIVIGSWSHLWVID